MDATFDHATIAVFDVDEAVTFFGVLGFEVTKSVRISGATMDAYMGIPGMEADHVTLAIPDAEPHEEVQLLCFHRPEHLVDRNSGDLAGTGFNHLCFRVTDLDATVAKFEAAGFPTRNQAMDFHDRKLVFLVGPANVVIELAAVGVTPRRDALRMYGEVSEHEPLPWSWVEAELEPAPTYWVVVRP